MITKKIDKAVHSLKDIPYKETPGLIIKTFLKRNSPREVLISKNNLSFEKLKKNSVIGTSSFRREFQLKVMRPDLKFKLIRGNIDSRIKKIYEKKYDAIILAKAGLKSLKMTSLITQEFDCDKIIPSAGQGVISLQSRKNDNKINKLLEKVNDKNTEIRAKTERKVLKILKGDCSTAVGIYSFIKKKKLILKAELFSVDGKYRYFYEYSDTIGNALKIGSIVGNYLKKYLKANIKTEMHILLTRQLQDSKDLIQKFKSNGFKVSNLPLLEINKLDYDEIKNYNYNAIIFTSSNAIKFLNLKNIKKNILCFCVGSHTEKTARSNGFQNVIAADGNVRNLKELVQQNLSIKDNKILYVSGDILSFPLDKELISEGYNVERLINYTVKHNKNLDISFLDSLKKDMPNLVYVYSENSAKSFLNLIKKYELVDYWMNTNLMCIGEKTSSVLNVIKWKKIFLFNPGEEEFLLYKI